MRTWSLRRSVMTLSALALIVVMALGVVAFALALTAVLHTAAEDAARAQAEQLATSISAGEFSEEGVQAVPARGSLLQLLDANGAVIASSDPAAATGPLSDDRPAPGVVQEQMRMGVPGEEDDPYVVVARGVATAAGDQVLIVASPLNVESTTVRTATVLLAVGAALLTVVVLWLINRVISQALHPVERIRQDVSRIRRARTTDRVTVPATGDEIARLASTMNEMLDRLEESDAQMRQFVSDASHELRSPLATVRAALEIGPGRSAADTAERDAIALAEVLRMQYLVEDLLTLAKADDRGLALAAEDVDVDDLVDREVRRLRATSPHPVFAHIDAARVRGDETRLTQVLRNLVGNAESHTRGAITITVGTRGREVVLQVDNQGPPIPPDQRERIFDRFVRLEDSRARDHGGSGLGLAISRVLVGAHGGTLRATETPTGQCRFELRLPAA
jgi:signal transduction histidine kinase